MGAPSLALAVEPSESGTVLYMSLAPATKGGKSAGLLCLRLMITNSGPTPVHLDTVTLTFTPPSGGPVVETVGIDIPAGWTVEWNFATDQDVILPSPAPTKVKLGLSCTGYSAPFEASFPLAVYTVLGGGYLFPTTAKSLKTGEFWNGSSGNHGAGSWGSQLFAYDLGVIAFDSNINTWSGVKTGTNGDNNDDFLIWGKPVCAVADGVVVERIDGVPNNPHPLKWVDEADLNAQLADQMNNYWGTFKNGGAGNHYYIQHGEEIVLYAHMQNGSLNTALLETMTVKAGDQLGLAGNAGNSTAPHLHVHAVKGTTPESGPLRPMPFRDTMGIDLTALTTPFDKAPWATLADQGPAHVNSAIYPAAKFPPVLRKNIYEAAIDPLALVLSNQIYVLLTLPDPPPIILRQLVEAARALSPRERQAALGRLRALREGWLPAIERALTEPGHATAGRLDAAPATKR